MAGEIKNAYVIGEELLMDTINYLRKQPWEKVNPLIQKLQALPEFVSTEPEKIEE